MPPSHPLIAFPIQIIESFGGRETAFVLAYGILGSALALGFWVYLRHRAFVGSLSRATRRIKGITDRPGATQEARLTEVDQALSNGPLAPLWRPYRGAIEPNPAREGDFVNLLAPAEWFAVERLPGNGYERWAATLSGVFLTIGLFFTFVGLAAALLRVGDAGGGADLLAATGAILRISSAKFITSIAGLAAFIGWLLGVRALTAGQAKAAWQLASAVQSLTTPLQPEALLFLQAQQARLQTAKLNALAKEIADALDAKLAVRLASLPIAVAAASRAVVDAVGGIGERIQHINEDAIARMAVQLGNDIRMAAGTEMRAAAAALRDTAKEFVEAKEGIAAAGAQVNRELCSAADAVKDAAALVDTAVSGGARGFREALGRASEESAKELAGAGQAAGDALRAAAGQAGAQVVAGLDTVGKRLLDTIQASAERLERAGKEFGSRMDDVGQTVHVVQTAIGEHVARLGQAGAAVTDACGELGKASRSLRGASKPVSVALQSAEEAAAASRDVLARAGTAAGTLEAAGAALQRAANASGQALEQHAQRFGQVDAALARTLQQIKAAAERTTSAPAEAREDRTVETVR